MLLSRHQNAGRNHDIKIASRSFENVAEFSYMETIVTHQNSVHEEIKRRLNSGNVCYHSANIIRMNKSTKMRWAGHVAGMEKRHAYRILVVKPEGKRPLGRSNCRWIDNIKIDFREIG
ncbi:hypothetical protein B7P43_G01957 [Cryptotermes secundus]|uniref:Uncharacterized protein n=1 Tax=Cryptotermes secundus TaxID=105785 RepID=A0A2J7RNI7_9NEOP|nr:hypothetical protein B7P43_G01957 [Cryptotermes secundus]